MKLDHKVIPLRNIEMRIDSEGVRECAKVLASRAFAEIEALGNHLKTQIEAASFPVRGVVHVRVVAPTELLAAIEAMPSFRLELAATRGLFNKLDFGRWAQQP